MSEESYEIDTDGQPVAEADPAVHEAMRRQVEATLRFMALSTLVGLVIIVVLAIAVSSIRGVLILVGVVYLLTSLGAYLYLRRTLNGRLQRGVPPIEVE
jgi:Flp pilus assembly protein TadB